MPQLSIGGLVLGKLPVIKKVQHGTITLDGTSATDTIDTVVTANSLLMFLGQTNAENDSWEEFLARIELTNSTTVTAYRDTDEADHDPVIKYCVVEFMPGIIKSNQSGTITITEPDTSDTAIINSVNKDKSFVSWLGRATTDTGTTVYRGRFGMANVELTNATTVTATRHDGYAYASILAYQVVEFY